MLARVDADAVVVVNWKWAHGRDLGVGGEYNAREIRELGTVREGGWMI